MSTNKATWGPAFWLLLHGWAERGIGDEVAWLRLLRWLPEVLPCRICQEHARLIRRPAAAAEIRIFLYNFHQSVNVRLRIGGRPFPISDLDAYRFRDLTAAYKLVLASINAGIGEGVVSSDAAHAFKAHAEVLRIHLGIN